MAASSSSLATATPPPTPPVGVDQVTFQYAANLMGLQLVPKDYSCQGCVALKEENRDLQKEFEGLKIQLKDFIGDIIDTIKFPAENQDDGAGDNPAASLELQKKVIAHLREMITDAQEAFKRPISEYLIGKVPSSMLMLMAEDAATLRLVTSITGMIEAAASRNKAPGTPVVRTPSKENGIMSPGCVDVNVASGSVVLIDASPPPPDNLTLPLTSTPVTVRRSARPRKRSSKYFSCQEELAAAEAVVVPSGGGDPDPSPSPNLRGPPKRKRSLGAVAGKEKGPIPKM